MNQRHNSLILSLVISIMLFGCSTKYEGGKTYQVSSTKPLVFSADSLQIHYRDYDDVKEAPATLLFVHGWCIDQSYWASQVEFLKADYRIVSLDLPGFGESGKSRKKWSMEAYGDDVRAVINQLQLENVILIGHSMGGDVVLEAALDNEKVIGVIGVDNFKDVAMPMTEEIQAEIDGFLTMIRANFSQTAPAYAEAALFHPDTDSSVIQRVKNDFQNSDSLAAIGSITALLDYAAKEPQQLSALSQKLYLIHSDATPAYLEGLDGTGVVHEITEIQGTGHYPMIEKPELFTQILQQLIEKLIREKD
ncbi:MAG: alpha/beta hydrolase [Bacteroidota bacterium]